MSMENHGGMIGREKLLICPPGLSGNSSSSHLVAKQEELGEGSGEFGLTLVHTSKGFFNMP
jgi:hypothetical protein